MIVSCELCGDKYVADSAPVGYSARCPSCRGDTKPSPPPPSQPLASPPTFTPHTIAPATAHAPLAAAALPVPPVVPDAAAEQVSAPAVRTNAQPAPAPSANPRARASGRIVAVALAVLVALTATSVLSVALEPPDRALATTSRALAADPYVNGFEVALGEPPAVRLSHVEEGRLELLADPQPAAEDAVSRALASAPIAHVAGLMANAAPELNGAVLMPIGGAQGKTGERIELGNLLGGGTINDGSWASLLQDLRLHGLDIIIVFDSTGSMGGQIAQVKAQIEQIGVTLKHLIPKARLGMCTYRDYHDAYVTIGQPLTEDVDTVVSFLNPVQAGGGGDEPEAVLQGLRWAVMNNRFEPRARKVILLFGDAPPHPAEAAQCAAIAREFHRSLKGIVSTVTCNRGALIPDFVRIADAGGGEAFSSTDQKRIMEQLIVLVFGSRHRDKVLEAFKLMEP